MQQRQPVSWKINVSKQTTTFSCLRLTRIYFFKAYVIETVKAKGGWGTLRKVKTIFETLIKVCGTGRYFVPTDIVANIM